MTLVEEYRLSVVVTSWLDANGDMTRGHARVRFEGTITGPGSTLRLSDESRYTSFIDFGPDGPTVRDVGLQYKFSAPGSASSPTMSASSRSTRTGRSRSRARMTSHEDGLGSVICPLFT